MRVILAQSLGPRAGAASAMDTADAFRFNQDQFRNLLPESTTKRRDQFLHGVCSICVDRLRNERVAWMAG
jgi:hypothetical protein